MRKGKYQGGVEEPSELGRSSTAKLGIHKTVKARFWPWLEPSVRQKPLKPFTLFTSCSTLNQDAKWFRGGLVFKAQRLLYHSTLGPRVIDEKK
jgi:hypothetical protein